MNDLELRLATAMHEAVDDHQAPADLADRVLHRHRRRSVVLASAATAAVIFALALAVSALAARGGAVTPGGGPSAHPRHTGRPLRQPGKRHSSHRARRPRPRRSAPTQPLAKLSGLPMPASADVRLLLTGRSPAWFYPATGYVQPITGLPPSRFQYTFERLGSGWIAQPSPKGYACQPGCPGPRLTSFVIPAGSPAAYPVGRSQDAVAGASPGRLWLVSYRRGTPDVSTAPATAVQVTTSGQRIGAPVALPAGYGIQQAVGHELLLSPDGQGPGPVIYKLWNPARRRVIRTFADVIAASPDQVAYGPICGGCKVRLVDLATGRLSSVRLPRLTWGYSGTFSTDGRYLALQVSTSHAQGGEAFRMEVAVIDVATGRLTELKGTAESVNARDVSTFGWQAGTDELVIAHAGPHAQVAFWRPGQKQLRVAAVRLPRGTYPVLGEYG